MSRERGCGSTGGDCGCSGPAPEPVASINGVALYQPGERLYEFELKERAWAELLRQQAERQELLPPRKVSVTPTLTQQEQLIIRQMVDEAVKVPEPDDGECRRHYDENKPRFIEGRQMHLRHILFAVTRGVDVHRAAVKAEEVLLELMRRDAPEGLFAERAREFSSCPSRTAGGDLGWVGPQDVAEELSNELFLQKNPLHGIGLRPRIVHSRYGLHIVEVLGRKRGKQLSFEQVRPCIAMELGQRARATALHQYIRLLAGQSTVEGVDLDTPLMALVQ